MGKYIRHGAAVIVSAFLVWLTNALQFIETIATPEQLGSAEETLVGFVTFLGMAIFGLGYAFLEKFLKRFRALDPEGAADREVIKEEADARGYS